MVLQLSLQHCHFIICLIVAEEMVVKIPNRLNVFLHFNSRSNRQLIAASVHLDPFYDVDLLTGQTTALSAAQLEMFQINANSSGCHE